MGVILVFSCFTGFFLVENCDATSNIIYVDDDNTAGPWDGTIENPYQYIQDGIDASTTGDTVYVYSGAYYENIEVDNQINLQGENQEDTIIDGNDNGDAVSITVDGCSFSGFQVINSGNIDWNSGIRITSSYNTISENKIIDNHNGITFSVIKTNNEISDNIITNNDGYGIYSIGDSNTISSNTITNNGFSGIYIDTASYCSIVGNIVSENGNYGSIRLVRVSYSTFSANAILNNNIGINLQWDSSNNVFYDNEIIDNEAWGIYISSQQQEPCNDNIFYHNTFECDSAYIERARDGCSNTWYNITLQEGNYWDDYNGIDSDGDGIGDTPYDIPGGSNQDLFPLGYFDQPPNKPYCLSPTDGSTNIELIPTLKVNVFDPDGDTMDVYFYNASNDDLITYELGVDSGGTASIPWYGCRLSYDSTYYWYVIANDSVVETISDTWSFTTKSNQPPTQSDESPSDGETDISSKYVKLWITVDDDSCDNLKLYWRTNASGSWETIDTYSMGSAGGPASYVKSYVFPEYGKTYYWSVNLTDGAYWTNKTYHFTIKSLPPESNSPTADTGGLYYGTVDSTVYFTGTGSTDSDGTITNYTWYFGDGKEGYGISPTHIYSTAGNYAVILTVTDNNGLTDSDMTTAHISEVEGEHHPPDENKHIPVADADGPYLGYVNTSITLNASKSYDLDGFIVSYEWDFGDGTTGTGMLPNHTYNKPGYYGVTLVVTDNQSLTDTSTTTVTILEEKPSETPGFELIFAVISIAIVLFWKRKRY